MPFSYARTIHFSETDAAGIVFFPNYLALCHEAYEEALAAHGVDVTRFFSADDGWILPIARSEAEYLRPLKAGEKIRVSITPTRINEHRFALAFEIYRQGVVEKIAARVRTEHVCVSTVNREKVALPPMLARWIDAS